jgi:hypothetical protein
VDSSKNEKSIGSLIDDVKLSLDLGDSRIVYLDRLKNIFSLMENNRQKLIFLRGLPDSLLSELKQVSYKLELIKDDILKKDNQIYNMSKETREKNNKLVRYGLNLLKKDWQERAENTIQNYVLIMALISNKIEKHLSDLALIISRSPEKLVPLIVFDDQSQDPELHVKLKIKEIKSFIKVITKRVDTVFSRFSFGFDDSIKYLDLREQIYKTRLNQR